MSLGCLHIVITLLVKQNVVVQSLSHIWLFVTPWSAVCQTSLSFTISWSLLKLMSTGLVMPSNHLILCHPLLLLPSTFPSIRVFPNESAFHIRWLKYWSFSFSISPSNEYSGLISFRMDWFNLAALSVCASVFLSLSLCLSLSFCVCPCVCFSLSLGMSLSLSQYVCLSLYVLYMSF